MQHHSQTSAQPTAAPATHVVPLSVYFVIFGTLLLLTGTTVWVAFYDLGPLNNVVALGIAATKATLVLLYFMHLRYSASLNRMAVVGALAFVVLMIGFTLSDTITRPILLPAAPQFSLPSTSK